MINRFKSFWELVWNEVFIVVEVGEYEGIVIEGVVVILFVSIVLDVIFN